MLAAGFPFKDHLPLNEKLPRLPEPHGSQVFYYHMYDALKALSQGKSWTWCEVIPDVVVGYVPNNNTYCLAQTLSIYLSLYASINGSGATCQFPGNAESWTVLSNDSPQDIVARFSIYASLHPSETGGRSFNVAGNDNPSSWSKRWPVICEWFGLKGVGPLDDGSEAPQPPAYIKEHGAEWQALVKKHGMKSGVMDVELGEGKSGYQYFIMSLFDFDRQCDLSSMRSVGFEDILEDDKCWWTAFERFRKGKAIP